MEFPALKKTPLFDALSELGKRLFLPEGIFYWSGRAKVEAEINATIGSAVGFEKDFIEGGSNDWLPCYLSEIKKYSSLGVKNMVPYAPIGGLPELRESWKNWIAKKSLLSEEKEKEMLDRLKKYVTLPMVTAGVTNGIYLCGALFLSPGEVLISPNKRWENYDTIIEKFLGGKVKSFEFFKGDKLNIQSMKAAIDEVAKVQNKVVIILNFPNNPTGYVPTKEEGKEIVKALQERQKAIKKPIVVLVDDAYEPYVYSDKCIDRSIFYDLHALDEDVVPIKLDGVTKEMLMYGARIGFVTIGFKPKWAVNDKDLDALKKEINNKLEAVNRSTISNCNILYQAIAQKMFTEVGTDKIVSSRNRVKNMLKLRCDKINQELSKMKSRDLSVDPNSGGFFIFVNLNPKKYKVTEVADVLLKKFKVGVVPEDNPKEGINGIRIAYCSIDLQQIPEFVKRFTAALNEFK